MACEANPTSVVKTPNYTMASQGWSIDLIVLCLGNSEIVKLECEHYALSSNAMLHDVTRMEFTLHSTNQIGCYIRPIQSYIRKRL